MNSVGTIIVSWPLEESFEFMDRFVKVRPLLFAHGFNRFATTSSTFVMFAGDRLTGEALAAKIHEVDPAFTVEWEPSTK